MCATDLLTEVTGSAVTFVASPEKLFAVTVPEAVIFVPLIAPVLIVPEPKSRLPLIVNV